MIHAGATRAARLPEPTDPPSRRRRTADQRASDAQRITNLYVNDRRSLQRIADETGLSYGTVHRTLVDAGVQMRGRGGNQPPRRKRTGSGRS